MILFAQIVLLAWLPIVVGIFVSNPPSRAVVISFVTAWLVLPNIGFNLPGLPDYTKMSATVAGVLLCAMIFDPGKLGALRARWYDLPMFLWCFGPFATSISNGLGAYDGLSAIMGQAVSWGLPYLVGRIYLSDERGIRDLAMGFAVGGLCYVPLCLIEVRFSPFIQRMVYGIATWEGIRYGGYRPKVFLNHGLELGMWMTNATLLAYVLWSSGAVRTIRGVGFGRLIPALVVTAVLCKSTGAIALLAFGVLILWSCRVSGRAWAVWFLIAIPPFYTATRSLNLWSGREVTDLAKATVGAERADSFQYRIEMENLLARHALERPILGWGGSNRHQVVSAQGKVISVPDGYWIIALGVWGLVGLTSFVASMVLPLVLNLRRFPVATWRHPRVAPIAGMSLVVALMMVDFLANAMPNPLYGLAIGGLMGQAAFTPIGGHAEAEESLDLAAGLMAEGRPEEAVGEFLAAIGRAPGPLEDDPGALLIRARALDGLGQSLLASRRAEEAVPALHEALAIRDRLAEVDPEVDRFLDLATAREGLARALAESGRSAGAIAERRVALQLREALAAGSPEGAGARGDRLAALNDLAWLLATDPDPRLRDPEGAVLLAEQATRGPDAPDAAWNTLGVARYRAGDWAGAIEALERSALGSPDARGTAFDHYFICMSWWQLRHDDRAREWAERGAAWAARHRPGHAALDGFRREAEALLQGEEGGVVS